MADPRDKQHKPSASRNINDIVEQYSSPAPSSSPAIRKRELYECSLAADGHTDVSMSSSPPPPCTPSLTSKKTSFRHQRNTTNSGYLNHAKLLGRASPSGLPSSSSPLPEAPRRSVQHKRNSRSLLQMLDGMGTAYFSPLSAFSIPPNKRSSFSSMREKFCQIPQDEWMEAGTAERDAEVDSGSPSYASWLARGGLVGMEDGSLSYASNSTVNLWNTATEDASSIKSDRSIQKVSPAEMALREAMGKRKLTPKSSHAISKPAHARKSSWASRLFNRRDPNFVFPMSNPAKSASSEEDPSEFGYVAPEVSSESSRDLLARAEAREATEQELVNNEECTDCPVDEEVHALDDGYVDVQRPRRSTSAFLRTSSRSDPESPEEDSWASARSEALADLEAEEVFSRQLIDDCRKDKGLSMTADLAPTQNKVSNCSLLLVITTIDQAPVLRGRLQPFLAEPSVVFSQKPQLPMHNLAMSPISTIIDQAPISATLGRGLSFTTAAAIINGGMAFAAMRRALLGLGRDLRGTDLAVDLYGASIVAVGVCMILHVILGGQLKQAPGNMVRKAGTGLGTVYATLVDGFQQGRGH
jgi:hypothetical protein